MAVEKNIVIGADLSGLEGKLEELIVLLRKSQSAADSTSESVKKVAEETSNIADSAEIASSNVGGLNRGFRALGLSIKALGIGILLEGMSILKELFDNNQKTVDFFNTTFNTLQVAFSDFSKFISNNIDTFTGFFKEIFENPLESIEALGNAIWNNIVERFVSASEVLGFLSKSLYKFVTGDFKGAVDELSNAGTEMYDVLTGVDDSQRKITEGAKKLGKAISDYTKETVKQGQAMTETNKQAEIAEVRMQGLIEKYDLQAEKLRQVRDDERLSIDERIKANEELGEVLKEQEELMLENAQKVLDAKAKLIEMEPKNIEFQKEYIAAQNELLGVQAQVSGFRSEQLMNEMALQRELLDIERARGEAETEIFELQAEARREAMLKEQERIKQELMDIGTVAFRRKAALDEELETTEEGTARYYEIMDEKRLIDQEYTNNVAELKRREKELEREVQDSKVKMSMDAIGAINGLVQAFAGENEKAQKKAFMVNKAAGIANAVISTAQAVSKALAETTDPTPTQSLRFGNAAIAAATGAAQIATIARQQFNGGGSIDSNIPDGGTSAPTAPQFNLVGSTGQNAILESLRNNPVKAYVVGSDVTSQQELDRNRINQVSFP